MTRRQSEDSRRNQRDLTGAERQVLKRVRPKDRERLSQDAGPWPDDVLEGYTSAEWWHDSPATEKQVEALERRGLEPPPDLTKGQAAFVLDQPTPKQRRLLEQRGLWFRGMTFTEAREELDQLARAEGWRR
jgi:hypothetical protein